MTHPNLFLGHPDYTVPSAMGLVVPRVADRIAVDTGHEQITFSDLHSRASQVARALLDDESDHAAPVFVLCDAGVSPLVAICGALYAGRITAPVDVREPLDRLRQFFDSSAARCVLTGREHVSLARELTDRVLVLEETTSYDASPPEIEIGCEHTALILFTSGSTGTPKGYFNSHRDIVQRGGWNRGERLLPGDCVAITASWGFAAAQNVVFAGLLNGATTCLYDLRSRGARGLPGWISANEIVSIQLPPSVVRAFAPTTPPDTMHALRRLAFISETLHWSDVALTRPLV